MPERILVAVTCLIPAISITGLCDKAFGNEIKAACLQLGPVLRACHLLRPFDETR